MRKKYRRVQLWKEGLCRWDLGCVGGALLDIRDDFGTSEVVLEAIVGAAKIGAVFGTFLGESNSCCKTSSLQGALCESK
jgi:hypothetical protein